MNGPVKVYLGLPSYDGRPHMGHMSALWSAGQSKYLSKIQNQNSSWTTRNFNACYAQALNHRESDGITHFCLLHDDVIPLQPDWLDRLVDIALCKEADLLGTVIPFKSDTGMTSTALLLDKEGFKVKRLTMREVMEPDYEPTFTRQNLLLNTGLMLIDVRNEWADKLFFEFYDRIVKKDGKYKEIGIPEDWLITQRARDFGANIWATREVTVSHRGIADHKNTHAWGTVRKEYDPALEPAEANETPKDEPAA